VTIFVRARFHQSDEVKRITYDNQTCQSMQVFSQGVYY
jgi:hypothetical protein